MPWFACLILVVAVAASGSAWCADEATLRARAQFAEALGRVERGDLPSAADDAALREYPLYPYLTATRLMRGPASAELDAEIRAFLAAHTGEPVAFPLHRAWLLSLADRGSWRALVDHYARDVASTETECQYLRARVDLGEYDGLAPLIAARWRTAARLPPSCEPAFQWLRDIGALDAAATGERVRLLLDAREYAFARVIASRLPAEAAARYTQWADMLTDPVPALDAVIGAPRGTIDAEMLLSVWTVAARNHPRAAAARFEDLRNAAALDANATSRFALVLALGLAWDRQPDTLRQFARVAARELDDYALGWLVRAALWHDEWATVERALAMMSPLQRGAAVWRYWHGRALEARNDRDGARALYRSILEDDNFYAAMSAGRLRSRVEPNVRTIERAPDLLDSLESWPAIVRARELFALGRRVDATREWRFALQFLAAAEREQAVLLATDWGWHDVAVATATELGQFHDYEVLYPLPFASEIAHAADATRIGEEVLYGLIRQESLFREDAVSPAGAMGLTQLLPATARSAARNWRPAPVEAADLLEPSVSILLGAATLGSLRERYGDQLVVALAAYNAGPNAVERWWPDAAQPADIWIENIPFNETRDYVQRVIWHTVVYAWRRSGRPQDPSEWLDTVAPPDE